MKKIMKVIFLIPVFFTAYFLASCNNFTEAYNAKPLVRSMLIEGDGSVVNPFLVHDETELYMVGRGANNPAGYEDWTLSAHYKLTENINLLAPAQGSSNWIPIGTNSTIQYLCPIG